MPEDIQQSENTVLQPVDDRARYADIAGADNRYRLVHQVGRGGMGAVVLAEDLRLGRKVAIKKPLRESLESEDAKRRFEGEGRAAAKLNSPYLCRVFDVATWDGLPCLIMEYVAGESLSSLLKQKGPFEIASAVDLIIKLTDGLDEAHSQGVIHRDLKPGNVIVTPDGKPVVVDFGLAWEDQRSFETKGGTILGTFAYMSPEQAESSPEMNSATTDIYSLGVILYELLTGRTPYQGSPTEILAKHVKAEPILPVSSVRDELDEDLNEICMRALARRTGDRFGSMKDLGDALRRWRETVGAPEVQPSKPTGVPELNAIPIEMAPVRDQIFLSYSHRDVFWLEELQIMLKPLLKRRPLSIWSDQQVRSGNDRRREIHAAMASARVAILLVSPHFLASPFISEEELPALLAMSRAGQLKILWVPLSPCLHDDTDLREIQALHDTKLPLDTLEDRQRGSALLAICEKIRDIVLDEPVPDEPPKSEPSVQDSPPLPVRDETARHATDRNLLFGVLAVQMAFIEPLQFTEACASWAIRTNESLAAILVERGWMTETDSEEVERHVDRRVRRFGGNVSATLKASADSTLKDAMRQSQVPEILDSLDSIAGDMGELSGPIGGDGLQWKSVYREGKLGQIWTGFDPALGREVALKIVHPDRAGETSARGRLLQEARIAGRLEHPHIVPIYHVGERDAGDPYYAMRLVRGTTLADDIARHHQTRVDDRIDITERRRLLENLLAVCHATSYAHSKGYLHLDLKPQNVVLGEFREVYLLDWGLSQPAPRRSASLDTGQAEPSPSLGRRLVGTPAYMSPEQAMGDMQHVDKRTDVYGLGAILFEILTGRAPHEAEHLEAMLDRIQTGEAPVPRSVFPGVPPSLDELCRRALAREPRDRFASAEDLALALERWLDDEPLAVYRDNVDMYEQLLASDPKNHDYREGLARNFVTQGVVLCGIGRLAAAEFNLRRGIEVYQDLLKRRNLPSTKLDLATAFLHLHHALIDSGKTAEAQTVKRATLELYYELKKSRPGDDGYHSVLLPMMSRLDPEGVEGDAQPTKEPLEVDHSELAARRSAAGPAPSREPLPPSTVLIEDADSIDGSMVPVILPEDIHVTVREPDYPSEDSGNLSSWELATDSVPGPDPFVRNQPTRFRLDRIIAKGGLGCIWSAFEHELLRSVAVKTLRPEKAKESEAIQRLFTEALVTAQLQHPGIVPVHSLGQLEDGLHYYAMQRIRGVAWDRVMFEQTLTANLDILLRVADVVAFAHSRAVLHRDIKPENVMVGEYGEVYLIDWGLAMPLPTFRHYSKIMPPNRSGGAPAYMAPEMVGSDLNQVGPWSDVFLLGACLFEIISGNAPHPGRTVSECVQNAKNNVISPAPNLGNKKGLLSIAMKAMSTNPDERYVTVGEFQGAIRLFQQRQESEHLVESALAARDRGREAGSYSDYSRAIVLFEEALSLWGTHPTASTSLTDVRRELARVAERKGDLDFALSVLDSRDVAHQAVIASLQSKRKRRDGQAVRIRWGRRATVVITLAAAIYLVYRVCSAVL